MSKLGRPKKEDSMCNRVTVRLRDNEYASLKNYSKLTNLSVNEIVRKALKLLIE